MESLFSTSLPIILGPAAAWVAGKATELLFGKQGCEAIRLELRDATDPNECFIKICAYLAEKFGLCPATTASIMKSYEGTEACLTKEWFPHSRSGFSEYSWKGRLFHPRYAGCQVELGRSRLFLVGGEPVSFAVRCMWSLWDALYPCIRQPTHVQFSQFMEACRLRRNLYTNQVAAMFGDDRTPLCVEEPPFSYLHLSASDALNYVIPDGPSILPNYLRSYADQARIIWTRNDITYLPFISRFNFFGCADEKSPFGLLPLAEARIILGKIARHNLSSDLRAEPSIPVPVELVPNPSGLLPVNKTPDYINGLDYVTLFLKYEYSDLVKECPTTTPGWEYVPECPVAIPFTPRDNLSHTYLYDVPKVRSIDYPWS